MASERSPTNDFGIAFGSTQDRRVAVQREQNERAAERVKQLASQTSPLHDPPERIRIWERLHGLSLPRAPSHKLVRVIATQTDLSIRQVQEEQQRRAAGVAVPPPGVSA